MSSIQICNATTRMYPHEDGRNFKIVVSENTDALWIVDDRDNCLAFIDSNMRMYFGVDEPIEEAYIGYWAQNETPEGTEYMIVYPDHDCDITSAFENIIDAVMDYVIYTTDGIIRQANINDQSSPKQ